MKTPQLIKPESCYVKGTCVLCGDRAQAGRGYGKYRAICQTCHDARTATTPKREKSNSIRSNQRRGYRQFKKDHCEECGFVAVHACQLDVDHHDGNKANDDPANLVTLCANCHRLKTYLKRDCWNKPVYSAD